MELFKRAKENPKTTKKGVITGVVTGCLMAVGTFVASKNPELGVFIKENGAEIITSIVGVVVTIVGFFANKKDE